MESEFNSQSVSILEQIASIDPEACNRIVINEESLSHERSAARELSQEILSAQKLLADVHSNAVRPNVAHALIGAIRTNVFYLLDRSLSRWQGCLGIPENGPIFQLNDE